MRDVPKLPPLKPTAIADAVGLRDTGQVTQLASSRAEESNSHPQRVEVIFTRSLPTSKQTDRNQHTRLSLTTIAVQDQTTSRFSVTMSLPAWEAVL